MAHKKREKFFNIHFPGDKLRLRNIFKIKKDENLDLTLQIEINPGKWKPVVRWDRGPHKFFHRHLIYSNEHEEKEETNAQELDKVIINAIDDFKENWKNYIERTGYHEFSHALHAQLNIERDLERAKRFLLDLVEHPEKINNIPNKISLKLREGITFKDEVVKKS